MNYYVYAYTIARSDGVKTEIRNHQTNAWKEVVDPKLWRKIQLEGDKVTKEKAETTYRIFHIQINEYGDS